MVIPKDPPGPYNQEGTTPPVYKLPVNKIAINQPQQPSNIPDDNDDEVITIPHDMFDLEPTLSFPWILQNPHFQFGTH